MDRVADFYKPKLEELGMELIHFKRPQFWKSDGIAIAYHSEKVKLIDTEFVDLNELTKVYNNSTFKRDNQAMFCLFEHMGSRKKIIAGNLHLHFNPKKDHIKFAQASYVLEKGSGFARRHRYDNQMELPIFICGDYNSMPISSVMSLFHDEDIEGFGERSASQVSRWQLPAEKSKQDAKNEITKKVNKANSTGVRRLYQVANQMHFQKRHNG